MKIAMFAMGIMGDVQPYIYLARALNGHGHTVKLGSHPCWKSLIEEAGINFVPIGPDIDISKEAAIIGGKNSNAALSLLKTMNYEYDKDYVPYERLRNFLFSGDKPIILTLGAMSFKASSKKDKLDAFVNVFKRTGY